MSNRLIRYYANSYKSHGQIRWRVERVVIREVYRNKEVVAWDLYFQSSRKALEGVEPHTWAQLLSKTPKEAALREVEILNQEFRMAVEDAAECSYGIQDLSRWL